MTSVDAGGPIESKLKHFQAMAMRLSAPESRLEAAAVDRTAWESSLVAAPGDAVAFAAEWAAWAWSNDLWEEAAEAYANAHQALRRLLMRDTLDDDRRLELLGNTQYASRGAFALGKLGRVRDAVVLLERAGDLVTTPNNTLRDLQRLELHDLALRQELGAAIQARGGRSSPELDVFGFDTFGNLPDAVQGAQNAIDDIVGRIRLVAGFEKFLLPSGWDDVMRAVCFRPMAYIVPTDKGTACWLLAQNSENRIQAAVVAIDVTVSAIRDGALPFINAEFGEPRADARDALQSLLVWLGTAFMAPVRDALAGLGQPGRRISVRPFGMLAYLPLHATTSQTGEPVFAAGEVGYGYSARSLARSFALADEPATAPALVVENPRPLPVEFDPLPLASFETAAIVTHGTADVLRGRDATGARVLFAIPAAGLVHFICHGTVARNLGYSGILLLSDMATLSYRDLRRVPNLAARLVVLSACRGGATGVAVEHPVSLTAAFLSAGARCVVSSLWHADEMATVLLMTRFYTLWDGQDCAAALGGAQAWLQAATAGELRGGVDPAALTHPAGATLRTAATDAQPYSHPWYWAGFAVAGA